MKPHIIVMDENNNKTGLTYPRRAKRLVSKGRAAWLDDARTAVCLTRAGEKGIIDMEALEAYGNGHRKDEPAKPTAVGAPTMTDEILYKVAKERLRERFRLMMHWSVYLAAQIVFVIVAEFMLGWDVVAIFEGLWLAALSLHTVYYFIKITPAKIDREYRKLLMKKR